MALIICPRTKCIFNVNEKGSFLCIKRIVTFYSKCKLPFIHNCNQYKAEHLRKKKDGD